MAMIDIHSKCAILVTCPREIPPILSREITALGYAPQAELPYGVELDGNLADAMRLNLHLRTGHRVHLLLAEFKAAHPDAMYKQAVSLDWETILFPDGYVSIHSHVLTDAVNDSRFANQRLKDAICDRMRQKTGQRPDSGPDKSRTVIFLHWSGDQCQIWLDTSGEPLSRRGYRKMPHTAPMQETLAAAVVMASRYLPGMAFVNPMCGSGTLGLEAALLAMNRAPGLTRKNFGFMHVRGYKEAEFKKLKAKGRDDSLDRPRGRIILTDRDSKAMEAARTNARAAGVEEHLEFAVCDFRETEVPQEPGVVMINPEYGKRLGDEKKLAATYKAVGDFFKQRCGGYTGYIFTGNLGLAKQVGLRTARRMIFYNSRIECRLLEYELYAGSRKQAAE